LRRAHEQYDFRSEKQRGAGSASPHMWSMPQGMSGSTIGARSVADLGVSAPIVVPAYTPPFHGSSTSSGATPNISGPAAHGGGFPSPQFASPRDAQAFAVPQQV
jgi:hypothetical protein